MEYNLLSLVENRYGTVSSSITISGTYHIINIFANTLINLNSPSFIPPGIWDLNIFASVTGNTNNIDVSIYFELYGQIDSSSTILGTSS